MTWLRKLLAHLDNVILGMGDAKLGKAIKEALEDSDG